MSGRALRAPRDICAIAAIFPRFCVVAAAVRTLRPLLKLCVSLQPISSKVDVI